VGTAAAHGPAGACHRSSVRRPVASGQSACRSPAARRRRTIRAVAWTVLLWNMGLGSRSRDPGKNWARLSWPMKERSVDIALLNEVATSVLHEVDGALYEVWGTRGRDRKRRDWCTAIFSPHGCAEIRDAQAVSYRGRRPNVRFEASRPGSWTAGAVMVPGVGAVTCVSLYGLMDELSEASVHRSLSEISPLFSDPRYSELLLLGGDLNTSTQWPRGRHLDGDKALLARVKAFGLIDCLEQKRAPGRLRECPCVLGECTHTWTRLDPSRPALQVDYLFASRALAEPQSLRSCEALPPPEWQGFSDHAPVIATFDL
jgi:endonuclease/exonuclease/phosphatase family metal-dependent hydrolase